MLSTSKLVVAPEWQPTLRARHLDRFDTLWNLPGEFVKRSHSTSVLRATLDGRAVFVKKYWVTNPNQLLSAITRGALFGASKVRNEFTNLQQLRAWGLDAPAPVAWGEQRRAGWLLRSCLVTEGVPNPVSLDELIRSLESRAPSWPRTANGCEGARPSNLRTELIDKLADSIRRLHEHRFVHHDLFWRNIILSGHSLDRFHLIDAHKGQLWRDELAGRAHDLAALDAPAPFFFRRAERLHFFLRYREHERLTDDDKRLLRQTLLLATPQRQPQLARVRNSRQ